MFLRGWDAGIVRYSMAGYRIIVCTCVRDFILDLYHELTELACIQRSTNGPFV